MTRRPTPDSGWLGQGLLPPASAPPLEDLGGRRVLGQFLERLLALDGCDHDGNRPVLLGEVGPQTSEPAEHDAACGVLGADGDLAAAPELADQSQGREHDGLQGCAQAERQPGLPEVDQ